MPDLTLEEIDRQIAYGISCDGPEGCPNEDGVNLLPAAIVLRAVVRAGELDIQAVRDRRDEMGNEIRRLRTILRNVVGQLQDIAHSTSGRGPAGDKCDALADELEKELGDG